MRRIVLKLAAIACWAFICVAIFVLLTLANYQPLLLFDTLPELVFVIAGLLWMFVIGVKHILTDDDK